jgi:histidine triad (HIT) family protein
MLQRIFATVMIFAGGILLGGYLFSDTQPRAILEIPDCKQNCFSQEQLLGLLGSIGVQKFPDFLPFVTKETEKTLAMKHPFPKSAIHYVIIPKKDIKSVEDLTAEDSQYIVDAYAVMASLIKAQNLRDYKVVINGPGFQTVGYLHFQLVSELPK